MSKKNRLPDRITDFSGWYNDVIARAEIADQSPTRGCVVIRPYGYAIWEHIKTDLDARIKAKGIDNAYFPLLIPQSFLTKEADHVEGFSPELAVVTHAGGKKLEEPYVVRPTSETIIYHMFARWISSWRDLPYRVNQWANVVRWEMRTRAFLRTTEILWQEGHTAHATQEEADQSTREMLEMYTRHIEDTLAIPLFVGEKTAKERFAGAEKTYCMEAMMPDGKALQMGTSHLLAHSFPAAYGVSYQDKEGKMQTPWCSSWGMTTRLLGAALMVHGDENGLVLPPKIAPYQVVIVPIFRTDEERNKVIGEITTYVAALQAVGIRVKVDDRDGRPGAKFFEWELKGAPLRVEVGPRDIENGVVLVAPRVFATQDERKVTVKKESLVAHIADQIDKLQKKLFNSAKAYYDTFTSYGERLAAFGEALEKDNGFYLSYWCEQPVCEEKLVSYKAGIRCVTQSSEATRSMPGSSGPCFACEQTATTRVVIAKGY